MDVSGLLTAARGALALVAVATLGAAPALAQSGNFELELNTAADVPEGCRLTYVATNNTGIALTSTSYEVAVFDDAGAVGSIFVLEFGELPLSKTRVVQFDLPQTTCAKISRLLVNDQRDCASAEGNHTVCKDALVASSRISTIQFGL